MANVTGPASSTDTAIARWSGTSGTVIQDSAVLIDGSNNMSGINSISTDGGKVTTDGSGNLTVSDKLTFGTGAVVYHDDTFNSVSVGKHVPLSSGAVHTAIGDYALANVTGANNTGVGSSAGQSVTSGTYNTFLGVNADTSSGTGTNRTAIGYGASVSADNSVQIGNTSVTDIHFGNDTAILHGAAVTQLSSDSSQNFATTAFVQNVVGAITAGLDSRPSCRVATTAALTATYSNGSSGVGATLTNSGTKSAISIDGVSLSANDRVLVKNQATAAQNGIYTVTTVGSGSVNWVLTRATDFNTASGTGVVEGAFTIIEEGTSNVGSLWIETGAGPFTIGTTAITFTQLQVNNASLPHVTTFQYLTSGSSATYTTPANCRAISVEMTGGGGGGGAGGVNGGAAGGDTIFNSIHAAGGTGGHIGGVNAAGGAGGSGGTGSATYRQAGQAGGLTAAGGCANLGYGGSSQMGFGAPSALTGGTAGNNAAANSGGGGSGGNINNNNTGSGGGGGEYVIIDISSPASTYTYTVGAGGNGGAAGTQAGGNGGSGFIKVTEYY